ncbi:hypothetical protein Celaphus_00002267 [Cervus elaphus hippelaphus]|uniref:Uncharacterized protein n=1 Tax=Cervus elaphus hippelaphus TaxID=46360 RepID=A0A212CFE5_CEREH|nr:hypothetical protein Celaphus_00002267 [Cervus elaphus hippelaphus]
MQSKASSRVVPLALPSLRHVVTIPARNWHYCYCVRVVANFLNVGADFPNNFPVSLLAVGWLSGIHFVNSNN